MNALAPIRLLGDLPPIAQTIIIEPPPRPLADRLAAAADWQQSKAALVAQAATGHALYGPMTQHAALMREAQEALVELQAEVARLRAPWWRRWFTVEVGL